MARKRKPTTIEVGEQLASDVESLLAFQKRFVEPLEELLNHAYSDPETKATGLYAKAQVKRARDAVNELRSAVSIAWRQCDFLARDIASGKYPDFDEASGRYRKR